MSLSRLFKSFLRNLSIIMVGNLVGFAFVVSNIFSMFRDRVSFQYGTFGQYVTSFIIAYVIMITFTLIPMSISAFLLTYLEHKDKEKV